MDKLFIFVQHLLPKRLLTWAAGGVARCRWTWVRSPFIRLFIKAYDVNMFEARNPDPAGYSSFVDFFTRALKPEARPIDDRPDVLVCPADGAVSQMGRIHSGKLLQAKDKTFTAEDLLGGSESRAAAFTDGAFATIYLSPRDYHRVHMPIAGRLLETIYIPGSLYSVNDATARHLDRLFARNERFVALFETEVGPMAFVMVAAMIVGGMRVTWAEDIVPNPLQIEVTDYSERSVSLNKGDEVGRFELGSTVIVLFGEDVIEWEKTLKQGSTTRMGEEMAVITKRMVN